MALVLRSMWQWTFSGTVGQISRAAWTACLSTAETIDREAGQLPVMRAVEQWSRCGQRRLVRVEFLEVDAQMLDGLVGQRHDSALASFPGEHHLARFAQRQVGQRQVGDFTDSRRGVVEQDEQHPVAA